MFLGSAAATFLRPDQLIPSRQGLPGSRIAEGNRQRRREASCVLGMSSILGVQVPCAT